MFIYLRTFMLLGVVMVVLVSTGCWRGPARVKPPGIDALQAGEKAMEMYDGDGDGVVKGHELEAAHSLRNSMQTLDQNNDMGVDAEEVTARIKQWQESRVGLMPMRCKVRLNGRPLAGATVTFEPEKFLGDTIQTARGETNQQGLVFVCISGRRPTGIACGFYLVKISKKNGETETVSAKYNTQTRLGAEVTPGCDGLVFDISG